MRLKTNRRFDVAYWHLADICEDARYVGFRGQADIPQALANVRF
jgi:hypothetical protein